MSTFAAGRLSVLGYANGHTNWHYKIEGNASDVLGEGFFSAAQDMLAPGDIIQVSNADGAMMLHVGRDWKLSVLAATHREQAA